MIDVNQFALLLSDLLGTDTTQDVRLDQIADRVPAEVKGALAMCEHVCGPIGHDSANGRGAVLTAILGGEDMGFKYMKSVTMDAAKRRMFLQDLPKQGGIDPALAGAYLLVCSPMNARATIELVTREKPAPVAVGTA